MIRKICLQCGCEFPTSKKSKKYCSKICANNSLKKEYPKLVCQQCGKEFINRNANSKFCSVQCSGKDRTKKPISKVCEYCNSTFNTTEYHKRFCNTSCSANWRIENYGVAPKTEQGKKQLSDRLKSQWKDNTFRANVIKRMRDNNPSANPTINQKIQATKRKNNSYANNYKTSGNGKISPTELLIYDFMLSNGFVYNYAIPTRLAKLKYPQDRFANSYKPDYFNINLMLAVEIDGNTHKNNKHLDEKKEKCLNYLGITVIRFTNDYVQNNILEFKKEILDYVNKTN